jgi:hypothetical protein
MDFTKEELNMISQILVTVNFKIGQSKELLLVESVMKKIKALLETNNDNTEQIFK